MRYVIIGNGVAALGAIEGIRKYDREGEIVVISAEDRITYGRPLISYYLAGKVSSEDMALRPESYYEKMHVTLRLGTFVDCLDVAAKTAVVRGGERIPYDRLLVATGGSPARPDIKGLSGPDIYAFTSWAHAGAIEDEVAATAKKVVVIGGGLIALKAAEGLGIRGVDVTLMVRSRILRAYFDETASAMIAAHLERKGIVVERGEPAEILRDGSGRVLGVRTNKSLVHAGAVILAAGVTPSADLARCAGVTVNRGILVDEFMRTSAEGVYAAGDVAEARDILSGAARVIPIWPNAYNQGVNAGINMAGANKAYPGSLSMNATSFHGLPTVSVGLVNPPEGQGHESHSFALKDREVYRKLVFRADGDTTRLVGCILVGDVDNAGLYASFIRYELPLQAEAKAALIEGSPSPLFWPEEFFDESMRPEAL